MMRTLIAAQMGRFFSHFGVRSLLLLYLTSSLAYGEGEALARYAIFYALLEVGGILGGIVADRFLGLGLAVRFGSVLLGLGFVSLLFEAAFSLALVLILVGSSLFCSNASAWFGTLLPEGEKEGAFARLYRLQNVSALAGVLVSSLCASYWGFKVGLGVASLGALTSACLLLKVIGPKTPSLRQGRSMLLPLVLGGVMLFMLDHAKRVYDFLPLIVGGVLAYFTMRVMKKIGKEERADLVACLMAMVLFFAIEDQIMTSLLLFASKEVDLSIFGFKLPPAFITMVNPLVILCLGKAVARLRLSLTLPFWVSGIAFGCFGLALLFHLPISLGVILVLVGAVSVSELIVGPRVFAQLSQIGGIHLKGEVMGLTSLGFASAYLLSGFLSRLTVSSEGSGLGFLGVALYALAGVVVLKVQSYISVQKKGAI